MKKYQNFHSFNLAINDVSSRSIEVFSFIYYIEQQQFVKHSYCI